MGWYSRERREAQHSLPHLLNEQRSWTLQGQLDPGSKQPGRVFRGWGSSSQGILEPSYSKAPQELEIITDKLHQPGLTPLSHPRLHNDCQFWQEASGAGPAAGSNLVRAAPYPTLGIRTWGEEGRAEAKRGVTVWAHGAVQGARGMPSSPRGCQRSRRGSSGA